MAVYNINGQQLDTIYELSGDGLDVAYSINSEIVFQSSQSQYFEQIRYLKDWLINKATYISGDNTYVKERYRMDTSKWVNGATAIACAQAMFAYAKLYQYTENDDYLSLVRNLYGGIHDGRKSDGGFEMYVYYPGGGGQSDKYTGGNSEVPINLFRVAEIDTNYSAQYIQEGLLSTDYLLTTQNTDGSWRTSVNEAAKSSMFTAQAIAAIAMGYQYTQNKNAYLSAIQNGFDFISTRLLSDGRIKSTFEESIGTGYGSEEWRPPTSDQAIVIRGLAIVELYMADYMNVSDITAFRHLLLPYLNNCIGSEGSIRNGLGTSSLPNDIFGITDHVYTTSWAIEAYYYSSLIDNSASEMDISDGIIEFCAGNLYFSNSPNTNGTIRGAYNVRDGNWDTSVLYQDASNEGGADQIYVGWAMAPILSWTLMHDLRESIE